MSARSAPSLRALGLALIVVLLAGAAAAQTIGTSGSRTLIAGTPPGGSPVDRVNGGRSGQTRDPLPGSGLRVEWQTPFLGVGIDQAPLVDPDGNTLVLGGQGEVVVVGRDGVEVWRAATGALQPGPGALLSDGSIVFVSANGEAFDVKDGRLRWRTRFGRSDAARPAPLPLEDGGVIVATQHELAALDADGNERARTVLPEPSTAPLVAALGRVVVVATSGAVYAWSVGRELDRVGAFGSAVDHGAALADGHTLLAITDAHTHLTAVDLARGATVTRAVAPSAIWLGPPANARGIAHVLVLTASNELLVAVDAAGNEVSRTQLSAHAPLLGLDGGPLAIAVPPHAPPLVDPAGEVAFVTPEGAGAGITNGAAVELVADVCPPSGGGPAAAGLAPLGPRAFVVACRAGTLVALRGK